MVFSKILLFILYTVVYIQKLISNFQCNIPCAFPFSNHQFFFNICDSISVF